MQPSYLGTDVFLSSYTHWQLMSIKSHTTLSSHTDTWLLLEITYYDDGVLAESFDHINHNQTKKCRVFFLNMRFFLWTRHITEKR